MASRQLDEEAIFHVARTMEDSEIRSIYLDQVCADDIHLRSRVESLLKAHEKQEGLLQSSPDPGPTEEQLPVSEGPGTVIGRYKLLQKIGEGGFGVVFMGEQQSPVVRKVALKIIKPGMDSYAVVARFEAERQALALMDHPNIAHIFDGGSTDSGRPYFVMELVKGVPITEYCDRNQATTEGRLHLFLTVCGAVQHAHQKGVIHRDLKPSNIMVTLDDGKPVVKVIDFGVAKALNQPLTEKTLFTAYGQMVGTVQYMSPEQAEMSRLDVDTRSDVYALGVILYELMTGTTPIEAERLRTAGYAEMQRLIREEEPPRPSIRLSSAGEKLTIIAKHRSIDPARLRQLVRGEIDWIVMKSLEKDRNRRYDSPTAFAADIERFLKHEAVLACPPTASYRLRKFVARRKVAFATATITAAAMLLGIIGLSAGMISANQSRENAILEKERADAERARAEEETRVAEQARAAAETAERKADEARVVTEMSERGARRQLYVSDMNVAAQAWQENNLRRVHELLKRHGPEANGGDFRGFEWYHLWQLCKRDRDADTLTQSGRVRSMAVSSKTNRLAVGYGDGLVVVWDLPAKNVVRTFRTRQPTSLGKLGYTWQRPCVAFSPDGEFLAYVAVNGRQPIVYSFQEGTDRPLGDAIEGDGVINSVAYSPDQRLLATGGESGVSVYDLQSGEVRRLEGQTRGSVTVAFSQNGNRLASGGIDGSVVIWDTSSHSIEDSFAGSTGQVWSVAFSPNGTTLACGNKDGTVKLWDLLTHEPRLMTGHSDEVRSVTFSPDGELLASGSRDNTATLWDVATGRAIETLKGHSHNVECLAFWQHGTELTLATGSADSTVKLWAVERMRPDVRFLTTGILTLALRPDGKVLAARQQDSRDITLWNLERGDSRTISVDIDGSVLSIAISQRHVAIGSKDRIRLVQLDQGIEPRDTLPLDAKGDIITLAFSGDGTLLATGNRDGRVALWRIGDAQLLFEWPQHSQPVAAVSFTPDGKTLASGGLDGRLIVRDVESGNCVNEIDASSDNVVCIAFSTDGTILASAGADDTTRLWRNWRQPKSEADVTMTGHSDVIYSIGFLPDGRSLFSASGDKTLRIWDVRDGQQRFTLTGPMSPVESADFSAAAHLLASGSRDGTIRLWRAATEEEVRATTW